MGGHAEHVPTAFILGPGVAILFLVVPFGGSSDRSLAIGLWGTPCPPSEYLLVSSTHARGTPWALSIMIFQPWFLIPFCAARLLQVVLEATADSPFLEDVLDEYLESISSAVVLDLLDEYQSLLLAFLYAGLGVVVCLMLLWGAQVLSNWWAQYMTLL